MSEESTSEWSAEQIEAATMAAEKMGRDLGSYNDQIVKFREAIGVSSAAPGRPDGSPVGFMTIGAATLATAAAIGQLAPDSTTTEGESSAESVPPSSEAVLGFLEAVKGLFDTYEDSVAETTASGGNAARTTYGSNLLKLYKAKIVAMPRSSAPSYETPAAGEYNSVQVASALAVIAFGDKIIKWLNEIQSIIDDVAADITEASAADAAAAGASAASVVDAQAEATSGFGAAAASDIARRTADAAALRAELEGGLTETQVVYKEQCFLMSQIIPLLKYKKDNLESSKPLPYQGDAKNVSILASGSPFSFFNKLTQYPQSAAFHRMKPQNIANLVPMIRLYKVSPVEGGDDTQVELQFNTNPTYDEVQNYVKDKNKRGFGAGVKDFTFTYDGSNPFSAKKSIKAKLTIFANGFDELFMCRGNGKCDSEDPKEFAKAYRYIDLALKTGKSRKKQEILDEQSRSNLAKLEFRLKAVVGWATPKGFPNPLDDYELLDAINNSFVTLNLTPTIHEFNIEEDGRVSFTINYLAYIEEFFDQPQFNIFSDAEVAAKMTLRKLLFENVSKNSECQASEVAELKKAEADGIAQEKNESLTYLTSQLVNGHKMKYINLKREELLKFQNAGVHYQLPEGGISELIQDTVSDPDALKAKQAEAAASTSTPPEESETGEKTDAEKSQAFEELINEPGSEQIPFFYVSDLVDIILNGIGTNLEDLPGKIGTPPGEILDATIIKAGAVDMDKFAAQRREEKNTLVTFSKRYKKFRVVLGPVEVKNPQTAGWDRYNVSLGDLPVSYKYFLEWLSKKMLAKDESTYNLAQFLNDFFNTLIKDFMNNDTCFKTNKSQKVRVTQAAVTSYKRKAGDADELTQYIVDHPPHKRLDMNKYDMSTKGEPLLYISGPNKSPIHEGPIAQETNYLVFFAGRTTPDELMQGDRALDEAAGIFHYSMGEADGLVKRIALSKTDAKFLKEVRFEQDGYDGLKQLREVYDIQIDAFPIVNAYPGVYIYVEPKGWLPNAGLPGSDVPLDLTQYGIGGYCMIWKSEHSFASGRAESKIYAKWVASIGAGAASSTLEDVTVGSSSSTADPAPKSKCRTAIDEAKEAGTEVVGTTTAKEVGDAPATAP